MRGEGGGGDRLIKIRLVSSVCSYVLHGRVRTERCRIGLLPSWLCGRAARKAMRKHKLAATLKY